MITPPRARIRPAYGVVLLAAGASSRMGRPKLLLPWDDTTVIGKLIRQWTALGAEQIAVVCRAGDAALAAELDRLTFPHYDRIENPHPEQGMFSSVLCAARWNGWKPRLKCWAIALGDQPHLQDETLRGLLALRRENPEAICQPVFDGRTWHPVLLPKRVFRELGSSQAGTFKEFLAQTMAPRIERSFDDPGLMLDLDRPEDYDRATKLYSRIT